MDGEKEPTQSVTCAFCNRENPPDYMLYDRQWEAVWDSFVEYAKKIPSRAWVRTAPVEQQILCFECCHKYSPIKIGVEHLKSDAPCNELAIYCMNIESLNYKKRTEHLVKERDAALAESRKAHELISNLRDVLSGNTEESDT